MGLRLPAGAVTVLLGEDVVRRRLMAMLDHGADVARVGADTGEALAARLARVRRVEGARTVAVDRITDGLDAAARRRVLTRVRALASDTGAAVLIDDADSVAALAVADHTLRADPLRGLTVEPVEAPEGWDGRDYRAS